MVKFVIVRGKTPQIDPAQQAAPQRNSQPHHSDSISRHHSKAVSAGATAAVSAGTTAKSISRYHHSNISEEYQQMVPQQSAASDYFKQFLTQHLMSGKNLSQQAKSTLCLESSRLRSDIFGPGCTCSDPWNGI